MFPPALLFISTLTLQSAFASNLVFVDQKVNMQTQFKVEDGTGYLISYFANGDDRRIRVTDKGDVRSDGSYMGWPYIVDKKGRLLAMDVSWGNLLRTKKRTIVRRLATRFHFAAASFVTFYVLGDLNIYIHSGAAASETFNPETLGIIGFTAFYTWDITMSIFSRTHRSLNIGANFFRNELATDVESLEFEPNTSDYIIHYQRDEPHQNRLLSELAPAYTKETDCLFELIKLVNK